MSSQFKHLKYSQKPQPYHTKVAELVCRYGDLRGQLLDIGSGVGHTLREIQDCAPQMKLTAADIDERCLALTEGRVSLHGKIVLQDVFDLFGTGLLFDTIVMSHTLEHLPRAVDVVRESMDLLRPGGILVLAVPNPVRPTIILANLRRRRSVNPGHVCAWDRSHWMNLIENILKLEVVCYAEDFVELPLLGKYRSFRFIERALVRLFPWFSYSHIAVIRRPTSG